MHSINQAGSPSICRKVEWVHRFELKKCRICRHCLPPLLSVDEENFIVISDFANHVTLALA